MRPWLASLLVALVTAMAAPAAAQERTSVPDVEDEVMCVSCRIPLNTAESPQADRQRQFIRDLVEQGYTKPQIKARLVDEYGEDVLAMPADDGVGVAAYAVPIGVVGVLGAATLVVLPRWRRRSTALGRATGLDEPAGDVTADELRRVERDLEDGD